MIKKIIGVTVFVFLTACGAQQQKTSGISEDTMLVVRGETLVGLTLSIGENYRSIISKSDLTPYEVGVLGVEDRENEGLQIMTLKVNEGEQRITVFDGSRLIVDRKMYFSPGQSRDLRVRQ